MKEKHQRKKRNYFLNQELQGKYIFKTLVIYVLSALVFTLFLALVTYNTQTMVYEGYRLRLGATPLILWKQMIYGNWIFIVLGGAVLSIVSIRLTHRIAGPLFRFEKYLDNMIAGDLTNKLFLRKKDEGKQLGDKLNRFNTILSLKIGMMKTISQKIEKETEALRGEAVAQFSNKTLESHLDKIAELNAEMKTIQLEFSIPDEKA